MPWKVKFESLKAENSVLLHVKRHLLRVKYLSSEVKFETLYFSDCYSVATTAILPACNNRYINDAGQSAC